MRAYREHNSLKILEAGSRHMCFVSITPRLLCSWGKEPPLRSGSEAVLLRDILTLIMLMWRIWWAPNNASKWQMGFNSAFKGLIYFWFYTTKVHRVYQASGTRGSGGKLMFIHGINICTFETYIYIYIYRVSQEECTRLREGVPYAKVYR